MRSRHKEALQKTSPKAVFTVQHATRSVLPRSSPEGVLQTTSNAAVLQSRLPGTVDLQQARHMVVLLRSSHEVVLRQPYRAACHA